ncbi:MAG: ATP-binding protein [Dehalococcoidia bacterium]
MPKPRSPIPDARRMMERAIEVMRQSVPEHRADDSPSPKVGAVLVRPDGSVETASRGELREGNHAEFILIERKCIGERLDGCTLFTTLEPCLNRNHPKRGCARHIVSARIKEVYVGVEDDNPAVAGKGIEHLRRHGVTIHLFDRDLQEIILAENAEFLEWARKQPEKAKEPAIQLSKYEDAVTAVGWNELSKDALNQYRDRAGIGPEAGSLEFQRLLLRQGLLVEEQGALVPSGFGLLLFGERPRDAVPQAGLLARADLPDGSSTRKEFGEALVLIPDLLEEWMNTVLPSTIDRSQMQRKEQVDLPFEMIREGVVNALIHRDYDLGGQKCQLVLDADTLTVKSPGGPIPPITLDQLNSFSAPMKSRNPQLHYVFARMGMAEEQGFGLEKSLKRRAEELGLPLPSFTMDGDYLVLRIFRSRQSVVRVLEPKIREALSHDEQAGWQLLAAKGTAVSADLIQQLGFDERKVQRILRKLIDLGLIRRVGKGRATRYEVLR